MNIKPNPLRIFTYYRLREWWELVKFFAGNPLALNFVSTDIIDLFDGDLDKFLSEGLETYSGIQDILDQQFNRLSDMEKKIMYWLAINREAISFSELGDDFVYPIEPTELAEALKSLVWRSLIEKNPLDNLDTLGGMSSICWVNSITSS